MNPLRRGSPQPVLIWRRVEAASSVQGVAAANSCQPPRGSQCNGPMREDARVRAVVVSLREPLDRIEDGAVTILNEANDFTRVGRRSRLHRNILSGQYLELLDRDDI